MKIIDTYIQDYRISKDFTIELDNGDNIIVNKYIHDSDWETDSDYDILWDSSDITKEDFDKMSDDEQEKIMEFIAEIKL